MRLVRGVRRALPACSVRWVWGSLGSQQIGVDIYCDTTRIAQQVDGIAPIPPLLSRDQAATAARLAQWSDTTLFQVAVATMFQPAALPKLLENSSGLDLQAFLKDRMAIREGATVRRTPPAEAKAALTVFMRRAIEAKLQSHPRILAWMERIASVGNGTSSELSSADAIALARSAKPATVEPRCDDEDFALGDSGQVAPTDYGFDASPGELISCTADEIAIRRSDRRAGEVAVLFPRWNYEIRKPS